MSLLSPPQPCPDESAPIARLFESEPHQMPHPDYIRSINLTSHQDSINSILKVHAHFHFKPVTTFLTLNYFHRFLAAYSLPETGWSFQLLSVACLSLAAKMEESHVPCLLDLQSLHTANIFDPRTIHRMELLVLATLNWRLRSVTPFDYLHHFISILPSFDHSVASDIILNTIRVIDFMRFLPSVIAAAAAISAGGVGTDLPDTFDERINRIKIQIEFHILYGLKKEIFLFLQENVKSCHQLMEEYLLDMCPDRVKAAPLSPLGVLDAAACANHSENPPSSDSEIKRPRLSAMDVEESL